MRPALKSAVPLQDMQLSDSSVQRLHHAHAYTLTTLQSLPWGDPEEAAGSPLNGAQWHLKYCC